MSIAIAAALGLLIGFINYTKSAIPTQILRTSDVVSGEKRYRRATSSKTTVTVETTTVEKDACRCCGKLRKHIEERRQQAREHKQTKARASSTNTS